MLITPEEIKQQTRQLWKECFHDSEEFVDVYFEEKYKDEFNLTFRADGIVAGAVQAFPYRATMFGMIMPSGYVSGLAVGQQFRQRGVASHLLRDAHRHLFQKGATLSFLIPGSEDLRHFYEEERHGAYWTASYRKLEDISVEGELDSSILVFQPDEWGYDLYIFYHNYTKRMPFMLHPSENDFFAALAACDLDNGWVLVARMKGRVVGICLAVPGPENTCIVHSLLVTEERVKDKLIHELQVRSGKKNIQYYMPVAATEKGSEPYAMARIINVENFLKSIAKAFPTLQMTIGVDHDLDIPENNGFYEINEGKVTVIDREPDSIVTPGGLSAMFLSLYPTRLEMMLDE